MTKKLRRKAPPLPLHAGVVQPSALSSHDGRVLAYFVRGTDQEQDFIIHAANLFFPMLDMLSDIRQIIDVGNALNHIQRAKIADIMKKAEKWDR